MLNLEEYLIERRDHRRERKLALELRQLPEAERFNHIQTLIAFDSVVGLKMANACLRKKEYFEALLLHGLKTADASSILGWLQCVIPRLGGKRVIAILTSFSQADPEAVGKAHYWLGKLISKNDPKTAQVFLEFNTLMSELELNRQPKIVGVPLEKIDEPE